MVNKEYTVQDWRVQAEKNNLIISESGKCQLCRSHTTAGLVECVGKSGFITHRLSHEEGINHMTIFLSVDAHALQHSEIHGRWNNHYHLSRLNLILNEKVQWNYKLSPLLSDVVNSYKVKHSDEIIPSPEPGRRGLLTVTDVEKSQTDTEYIHLVKQWAAGVFDSFVKGHEVSKNISELFVSKYSGKVFRV